jgi:hypothetical protein
MTAIQQMLMGGGIPPESILWDSIDGLASYMAGFMSEYRNPSFYFYALDGDSTFINDGGNDMFDGGNYTTPVLISGTSYTSIFGPFPYAISYSNTSSVIVDGDFKYASLGYSGSRLPLTVMGTRFGPLQPIGWQKGGNVGADGSGSLTTSSSTVIISGFTVYYFYRQTFGASSDPAVCDVYMLIGHPNWGSVIGSRSQYSDFNTNAQSGYFLANNSTNTLAIVTLLSKGGGLGSISGSDIATVVSNMVNRIKLYFGY